VVDKDLEKWRSTNWTIELTNEEIVPLPNKKGKRESALIFSSSQEKKDCLIKQNLYIKEKYNISNEAYHEISMTNPEIPSTYSLHKEAKQMNSKCIIQKTPGQAIGL